VSHLPPLEGLSQEITENLTLLETLDDQSLRAVMLGTVPADQAEQIHELLEQQQEGGLIDSEKTRLEHLQRSADLVMLRKARAAVLLRFRGEWVPTLAELPHLSGQIN
jgi:hypothetical protein